MTLAAFYLLVRCLLGCLIVMTRQRVSKDAELLVLRHENTLLRRQIVGVLRAGRPSVAGGTVAIGSLAPVG